MKLWVVCAFRNRGDLLGPCLASIAAQDDSDFGVLIGDDASDDRTVGPVLADASRDHPDWVIVRRDRRMSVVGNQATLIRSQEMDPADVLVFLDGDDRFAHPSVLSRLREVYADGAIDLTYGSYRPEPPDPGCQMARPIPTEVCSEFGGYRRWARSNGTAWNHLRTFRRRIFDAIPPGHLKRNNRWLEGGADFAMMTPALELAGGRHQFIPEVLVVYTSDRPDAEWRTQTPGIRVTHRYVNSRRPLRALLPMATEGSTS